MAAGLSASERAAVADERALNDATIDNGATVDANPVSGARPSGDVGRSLARARAAGLEWLLAAQYPNGGWPQYFPLRADYSRHITFNDDAMVNVLWLLDDVAAGRAPLDVADAATRARATRGGRRAASDVLRSADSRWRARAPAGVSSTTR